jgi:hypothetical protein
MFAPQLNQTVHSNLQRLLSFAHDSKLLFLASNAVVKALARRLMHLCIIIASKSISFLNLVLLV